MTTAPPPWTHSFPNWSRSCSEASCHAPAAAVWVGSVESGGVRVRVRVRDRVRVRVRVRVKVRVRVRIRVGVRACSIILTCSGAGVHVVAHVPLAGPVPPP